LTTLAARSWRVPVWEFDSLFALPRSRPLFYGACAALYRITGIDVTVLEGIDESTALVLLSETGMDMSKWPTEKNFTSWLGPKQANPERYFLSVARGRNAPCSSTHYP
jgi:hypothetical protein